MISILIQLNNILCASHKGIGNRKNLSYNKLQSNIKIGFEILSNMLYSILKYS